MHMLGTPKTMQQSPHYDDVVEEVTSYLLGVATEAIALGVEELYVDPGIGFGKRVRRQRRVAAGTAGTGRARRAGDGWHEQEVVSRHDLEGEGRSISSGQRSVSRARWRPQCGRWPVARRWCGFMTSSATAMAAALLGDSSARGIGEPRLGSVR